MDPYRKRQLQTTAGYWGLARGVSALSVGVVGSGISGLAAARYLARRHRVTLFESEARLGGHAHTHDVAIGGRALRVDTGFIVYNHRTYPRFVRLLAELGVQGRESDMSFGVRCRRCRLEYSSRGVAGLFAQRRRALDPSHLRLLADIPRFNRDARAFLARPGGEGRDLALGGFLDRGRYSRSFVRHFILPMGGAVWSAPFAEMRLFPARSFLRFFANHGWLGLTSAPQWWTIEGGSRTYVDAHRARASQRSPSVPARGGRAARPRRRDRVFRRSRVAVRPRRHRDARGPGPAPARRSLRRRATPSRGLPLLAQPGGPPRGPRGASPRDRRLGLVELGPRGLPRRAPRPCGGGEQHVRR